MTYKSNLRLLSLALTNLSICLILLNWLVAPKIDVLAQPEPPDEFLNAIYYDTNDVNAVFDHWFPYLSLDLPDPNDCTQHYDGTECTDNPPNGFGYDRHDGIDYGLNYEIVLAAADGTVYGAGWADPSDHTSGLGLFARIEHDDENNYITEYGHLSVLQVQTGDLIVANPDNRQGIIGISGSTGNSTGPHLHFGLIDPNGVRVNPYGWRGVAGQDPWELNANGAISHDVWIDKPSISTVQFDDGDEIVEPAVNNARMIIDDASADFSHYLQYPHEGESGLPPIPPECGQIVPNEDAYNGSYRQISANTFPMCQSYWHIRPDAFTPPGAYDVFVNIPPGNGKTLGAEYTIRHNGGASTAVLVQAAYPNDEHDSWVYIGRYDFAMQPGALEYIKLSNQTTVAEVGVNPNVVADAVMLAPAEASPPPVAEIYVSFASDGVVGNIAYADEDILMYDTATADWSLVFDGSDVGLANRNVDGFDFQEGDIYLSLNWSDKTQLYRFSPTSLGEETAGDLQVLFFSEELLDEKNEDVDGFSFAPGGSYLFSTVGTADTKGGSFNDEDVFSYTHRPDGYEGGPLPYTGKAQPLV